MASLSASSERVRCGEYLTDGKRLVRVLDVSEEAGWVDMEDAVEMTLTPDNELVYRCDRVVMRELSRWRKVLPVG